MSITTANETTSSSHGEGNKQPTAAASSDRQPPRRSSLAQAAAGGSSAVMAGKNKNNNRNDNNHKNKRQQPPPKKQQPPKQQQRDENNVGNNNNKSKENNSIIPSPSDDNSSKKLLVDNNLTQINDDPRSSDPKQRITKTARRNGTGRNTESFNPESTLVRPDLRVHVGSPHVSKFTKKLKHDDVVIVPELFGPEDDWDIYYTLIDEMRAIQQQQSNGGDTKKNKTTKNSEWIAWHEGAHLISKNPSGSPTFNKVINRLCEYFNIRKQSIGTRFNWYRDSSDWKPFHHDSAAYNPQRAKSQNITVGVSFGACRELAFLHATPFANNSNNGSDNDDDKKCRVYFPQTNNGVFSFGRDVNIHWKHGINALSEEEQDGKGRISIILWGLVEDVIEEGGSPALLGSDGVGPHAAGQGGGGGYKNRRRGNNNNNRGGRR